MPTYDATREAVVEVAQAVCDWFETHKTGVLTLNGVPFEMTDVARCSEFVRECYYAATGHNQGGVYFGGSAKETESMLRQHGKQVQYCAPGDIACFNRQSGEFGHIGVVRDGTTYFENTSSQKRGPGFVVSHFADIGWSRVTGFYRLLPARQTVTEPATTTLKVVQRDTGVLVATYKLVPGGDHIADQGKVYVA